MSSAKKTAVKISGKKLEIPPVSAAIQTESRPGGWRIVQTTDPKTGQSRRMRMVFDEQKGKFWAHVSGHTWFGEFMQSARGSTHASGGDSDLVSQFPGKVRKILVKAGQKLKEGEPLLLIEAMKMEFTIKAPADGTVVKLLVKDGDQIAPGTRFLDFESVERNGA